METFTQQLILITDSIISAPLAYCKQYSQIALLPLTTLPINQVVVFPIFFFQPLPPHPEPSTDSSCPVWFLHKFQTFRPSYPSFPTTTKGTY